MHELEYGFLSPQRDSFGWCLLFVVNVCLSRRTFRFDFRGLLFTVSTIGSSHLTPRFSSTAQSVNPPVPLYLSAEQTEMLHL